MSISFENVPSGNNLKTPFFFVEVDNSQAGSANQTYRHLLLGYALPASTATRNMPSIVSATDEAVSLFGAGSPLARMHARWRAVDSMAELWCMAIPAPVGVAAKGAYTVTGPATAGGTLALYIAGQKITIAVLADDTAVEIAAAVAVAINAATALPVTAAVDAGTPAKVNLTAKWIGEDATDIRLDLNYRGALGGEALPDGVGIAVTAMAGGTGTPDLTASFAALGDEPFEHFVMPWTDSGSLDAARDLMNHSTGRWSYAKQLYGHVWSARRGTLAQLVTFGVTRNDPHVDVAAIEPLVPIPAWEAAAIYAARNAGFLNNEPYRPTQTGELTGWLAAPEGKRFTMTERNSLLGYGIATTMTDAAGTVRIERAVTTYKTNAWGASDTSYMDVEPLFQLAYIMRDMRSDVTNKFGRHALANDGTRFARGKKIVTPKIVRANLIARYGWLERQGYVENADAFAKNLIVERDAENVNRLNILYPPDLVNQLRIFAVLNQFRLQYDTAA